MASQVLGSGFSLPSSTNTLVADEVVAKIMTCRSGGSDATFPGLQVLNREGNNRVLAGGVFGGATNMSDYLRVAPWSAQIAYNQGSWVSYSGSNWVRTAAAPSVVGVVPAGPDWVQQTAGYPLNTQTFFELNTTLGSSSTNTYINGDSKLAAAGVGNSAILATSSYVNGATLAPPQPVSWSQGSTTINRQLTISAPGVIAGTAPALSNDAVLGWHSNAAATGVGTGFEMYAGVGNPGGGAPANSLSLYAYPDAGGIALLFQTTPATTAAYGTPAEPAIFELAAPQQSGVATIATGAAASAAIPIAGLSATSIVMATNAGIVGTGLVDAAFDAIADTASTPGSLILRTSANVVAAAGVAIKWFIVRL